MASRTRERRSGGRRDGPSRTLKTLAVIAGFVGVGFLVVTLLGDVFQKGVQEVTLPLKHEDIIRQQSVEKEVDAALIAAVIFRESRFRDQTSEAGARGLMQITPSTAHEIERLSGGTEFELEDLANPDINIRYGTFYLAWLLDIYDDDVVAALAAYNAGPGNAEAWGGSTMTIDDIEFPETEEYVKGVLEKQREYRHTYERELGY
ncbi:MAG: lytic transglycosylase domain-containing protein [Solirubrobacterales bacterium]